MLRGQIRSPLDGQRAAGMGIGRFDLLRQVAQPVQQVESRLLHFHCRDPEAAGQFLRTGDPLAYSIADMACALHSSLDPGQTGFGQPPLAQAVQIDARRILERPVSDDMLHDAGDRILAIAEAAQGQRHHGIDDLEEAAARQRLELDEGKVRFDARRAAVHHQPGCSGRGQQRDLCIAPAEAPAKLKRPVKGRGRSRGKVRARAHVKAGRVGRPAQSIILRRIALAFGAGRMVLQHPLHGLPVFGQGRERPQISGKFRRCLIGGARQNGGECGCKAARGGTVIGQSKRHDEPAQIGKAEAQRPVPQRVMRHGTRRILRHGGGDIEADRPQPHRMAEPLKTDLTILLHECHEVEGSEHTGRVVHEHEFGAGVRAIDAARSRACVPAVDGGIELQSGIGRSPGRAGNPLPERFGPDAAARSGLCRRGPARRQVPLAACLQGLQETVRKPDRVVRILAGDGAVGFRIPVDVVGFQLGQLVALRGAAQDPVDETVGDLGGARLLNGRIELRLEPLARGVMAADGPDQRNDPVEALSGQLGAGNERGDLFFLGHLPVDEGFDIRMVGIHDDHLGRGTGRAAKSQRSGSHISDLEKGEEPGRAAAMVQRLSGAAQA